MVTSPFWISAKALRCGSAIPPSVMQLLKLLASLQMHALFALASYGGDDRGQRIWGSSFSLELQSLPENNSLLLSKSRTGTNGSDERFLFGPAFHTYMRYCWQPLYGRTIIGTTCRPRLPNMILYSLSTGLILLILTVSQAPSSARSPRAWRRISYHIQLVARCIYRLKYHPLAKYPGPLLAKITNLHGAYHALRGDLHLDMQRCHEKYGVVLSQNW